jgi:hypothetical protein
MADVIDMDKEEETRFRPEEWLRCGKTYQDVPMNVFWARKKLLTIPESAPNIPSFEMSIMDFISLQLPRQSSEFITSKVSQWFSCDPPHHDVTCLTSRTIPPACFVQKLEDAFGQAWFDGATSISDQRFNGGQDRLPLWVLTYWKEMGKVVKAHRSWMACRKWLEAESKDPSLSRECEDLFRTLGWNSPLRHHKISVTTHSLADLLSHNCLSEDIMELMVSDIQRRLEQHPTLKSTTIMAPSQFYQVFEKISKGKNLPRTLLVTEDLVKKEGRELLLIPVFVKVGGNHQIMAYIDFKKRVIGYGEHQGY